MQQRRQSSDPGIMFRTKARPSLVCFAQSGLIGLAGLIAVLGSASAETAGAPAAAMTLELNKLEARDKSCRAYFVIDSAGEKTFQSMKLDLVLFQPDGVIARRIVIDLGSVKAAKKTVKDFEFEGLPCEKIGSVLVNDVIECKTEAGPVADCLAVLAFKSLAGTVSLGKK